MRSAQNIHLELNSRHKQTGKALLASLSFKANNNRQPFKCVAKELDRKIN